jgi:RHS repeat-associated protein
VLSESTNGVTTHYIYGLDLLYTIEGTTPHHLHPDGLGSIIMQTDASAADELHVYYDVFGNISGSSGSNLPKRLFAGEETDAIGPTQGISLVYLRARYYDPLDGRFISRDPVGSAAMDTQTLNPYAYANNDPVNHTDPGGKFAIFGVNTAIFYANAQVRVATLGGALRTGVYQAINLAAVIPYSLYYSAYTTQMRALAAISSLPRAARVVAGVAYGPIRATLWAPQAIGLAGDVAGDLLKRYTVNKRETVYDEGTFGYTNPLHIWQPQNPGRWTYLPGISKDANGHSVIEFAW